MSQSDYKLDCGHTVSVWDSERFGDRLWCHHCKETRSIGFTQPSREEFEAGIWQLLESHRATMGEANKFVDAVLTLADAYSSGDNEKLTELRREVLHRESRPL